MIIAGSALLRICHYFVCSINATARLCVQAAELGDALQAANEAVAGGAGA